MVLTAIHLKTMNLHMEVIYVVMMENGLQFVKNIIAILDIIIINIKENVKEIFVLMTQVKKKFI